MATQIRFDLTAALENWRNELAAQTQLTPDDRRELDGHFQDLFAELRRRGLTEEESFQLARKRTGELSLLNREFKRAMKTNRQHWGPAVMAWAIYIISFFLPAYDQMTGWKSAILQSFFWPQALQGQWLAIHYLLLTFTNLLMLVAPLLLVCAGRDARYLKWLRGLSVAAVILAWSFIAQLLANHSGPDLRAGCYLWATSFVLLCVASLFQTTSGKARVAQSV